MKQYKAVQPHGKINQVFENIYMVTGTNITEHEDQVIQTSRNMIIIKQDEELILVNTVRLNDEGLKALNELGQVKHVIRIGAFHGYDDPFYVDHYTAQYWHIDGMQNEYNLSQINTLSEDTQLPIHHAKLIKFNSTNFTEGLILIESEGGILISCDSIQNWSEQDEFFSPECWDNFKAAGLIGEANIPSTWLGACQPDPNEIKALTQLEFKHLLSAHGGPLVDKAYTKISRSINNLLQSES